MLAIETAIRLIVIGQEILIATVFLFGSGGRAGRFSGALLMLSVVGYLYSSDAALSGSLGLLEPVIALLALSVPFWLWLFARAVFEAAWPRKAVVLVCAVVVAVVWGVYLAGDSVDERFSTATFMAIRILSLLVVAHALWLTVRGRPDDLIERRRAFRLLFVGIISLEVAAVLAVEIVLVGTPAPPWLDLTNVSIIAIMTLGLAIPMLRLNAEFFEPEANRDSGMAQAGSAQLGAAESIFHNKLLELMDAGYYRETGLTIPVLAAKLGYPEHQLRRLINGHLGYPNFSAFLNSYRIDEAKARLADPEKARTPVLTIALDLGYASLGPFNRAFKATTGTTPTDYRRKTLGQISADSE